MTVVAERVDVVEQLVHLKAARCDQAQGALFGRPAPAAAITALLNHPVLLPE